jgi:transposase, IS5 family
VAGCSTAYRRLLVVARASYHQTERVRDLLTQERSARLAAPLDRFLPLVERVSEQTTRRVLHGERVPAGARVLSLFEPHTAVLRRGKARQPTEFGAKIVLDEVEGGLVTRFTVCAGNADDALSLPDGLEHHQRCFGRAPDLLAGDRHFSSGENCRLADAAGVRRVVLPKRGQPGRGDAARERERWVGWGILAHNLWTISRTVADRRAA